MSTATTAREVSLAIDSLRNRDEVAIAGAGIAAPAVVAGHAGMIADRQEASLLNMSTATTTRGVSLAIDSLRNRDEVTIAGAGGAAPAAIAGDACRIADRQEASLLNMSTATAVREVSLAIDSLRNRDEVPIAGAGGAAPAAIAGHAGMIADQQEASLLNMSTATTVREVSLAIDSLRNRDEVPIAGAGGAAPAAIAGDAGRIADRPESSLLNMSATAAAIDGLLKGPQYARAQSQKASALLPLLRDLCSAMAERCEPYGRFLRRLGPTPPADWTSLADIPPLPVSMFKMFELRSVPLSQVVRELRSSSTTGSSPSRIFIDKTTAFRQSRALAALLKEDLGSARRPYLVLDAPESAQGGGDQLTARGAAIRGVGNFASSTTFAFRQQADGELHPDAEAIAGFFARHAAERPLLFGFTFIAWTRFILEMERLGLRFHSPGATLLHSGGWKKLLAQAVSKDAFSARAAAVLGCPAASILDFYGMVEQVGTVFVDCAAGNKHAPAFADVILRAPRTAHPVDIGQEGLIEVLSVLPSSYPGHALLTEDLGILTGRDDCPCGRLGSHFRFTRRVERAELRGCGDTFAQSRELNA